MHPLDNPIWNALTTDLAGLARRRDGAACFPGAVTSLAGLRAEDAAACVDLAALLSPGERTGLFLGDALPAGIPLVCEDEDTLLQMVHEGQLPAHDEDGLVELGAGDVPAMQALAAITRPGPFGARTRELGTFLGLREDGALVAMAGQRLRMPGLIEASAICSAPTHQGKGLARRLTAAMVARIHAAGATAFLHVRSANTRAITLYEQVGFRARRTLRYAVVRAA